LQARWKSLWCTHEEFSYESFGERILKIGQHFGKVTNQHQVVLPSHTIVWRVKTGDRSDNLFFGIKTLYIYLAEYVAPCLKIVGFGKYG